MNNWCRDKLEWAVITLFQLVMPLFLFYRVADRFSDSCGENGAEWSVRAQNDATLTAMLALTSRFALSPTVQHTFCGSNWQILFVRLPYTSEPSSPPGEPGVLK